MALFGKKEIEPQVITEGGYIHIPESVQTKVFEKAKLDDSSKLLSLKNVFEHPYDYSITRNICKEFGLISGMVDKYVDNIIGPGLHVKSKNKAAENIINEFIRSVDLPLILKPAFKEALKTGLGPVELQLNFKNPLNPAKLDTINSSTIYRIKDSKGKLKPGFKQILSKTEDDVDFKESEIICFEVNKLPGQVYGYGIIYPALKIINNYLKNEKDMHKLISRKANSPIHVKIGDKDKRVIPTQNSISAYGSKLHYMRNQTEWCTDPYVEMKVLDFGNVGEKFSFVLENDLRLLMYSMQIPEVIMGKGNIPEGIAKVQLDGWDRTIQSLREDFEKPLEQKLFKRILEFNGIDADVEVEWDRPGTQSKNEQIKQITEMLKLFDLDMNLRLSLEQKLADLLGVEYKQQKELERKNELSQKQPLTPGQNKNPPTQKEEVEHVCCDHIHEQEFVSAKDDDVTIQEWVGYDYTEHIAAIEEFLDSSEFITRKYKTFNYVPGTKDQKWIEYTSEYSLLDNLNAKQVGKLRNLLKFNFRSNNSMREIMNDVLKEVKPGNLTVKIPEIKDENGNIIRRQYERVIPERQRAAMIARGETVRASNQGSLTHFKNNGINEVAWVSAYSDRTCTYCESQNGKIMTVQEAQERIPSHTFCRCSWIPHVRE